MSDQDSSEFGLGQSEKRHVTEDVPLPPTATVEDILSAVREILIAPGATMAIHIVKGQPIRVERMVGMEDDLADFIGEDTITSVLNVIRASAEFLEYTVPEQYQLTSYQQIWEMFHYMATQGLQVSRILVGSMERLSQWFDVPAEELTFTFGTRIEEDREIPPEAILVCGAPSRISSVHEISKVLKGVMS